VLLGDALVAGGNAASELAAVSAAHGGASVVGLERVPRARVSRYGIVRTEGDRIVDLVEKPSPEEAPSDLAIAGRYILDTAVFELLATQAPGKGGEIQLTDAIRRLLAAKPVFGHVYPGKRQDIGNPQGYFKALEAFNGNG
jgi:UTP--glucose-1-phosphate uridylyltransferase